MPLFSSRRVALAVAGLAIAGISSAAQADTTGLPLAFPNATWDTFPAKSVTPPPGVSPSLVPWSFSNAAAGSPVTATEFSSTLSLDMDGGSTPSSGDRIYQGMNAGDAAFDLTFNGTANENVDSIYLFVKFSQPTGYASHANFFSATLNGLTPDANVVWKSNVGSLGTPPNVSALGIVFFEWTGLNLSANDAFSIALTSPAAGHASIDALMLSTVPEPTALGLVGAAGLMGLRRRRQA